MKLITNERIENAKAFADRQDVITGEDEEFKFENPEKQFYVLCWWGKGANGSFCNRDELVKVLLDSFTRDDGEAFSVVVYDLDERCEVVPVITEIELEYEQPSLTEKIQVRKKAR